MKWCFSGCIRPGSKVPYPLDRCEWSPIVSHVEPDPVGIGAHIAMLTGMPEEEVRHLYSPGSSAKKLYLIRSVPVLLYLTEF